MNTDFKVGKTYDVKLKTGEVVQAVYVKMSSQVRHVSQHVLRSVKPWNGSDTFLVGVVGHQPLSDWECTFINEVNQTN